MNKIFCPKCKWIGDKKQAKMFFSRSMTHTFIKYECPNCNSEKTHNMDAIEEHRKKLEEEIINLDKIIKEYLIEGGTNQ